MSSLSRQLTTCAAMACAACAVLLMVATAARAADDLPYVYVPPIDVDVNVDLGPHRPPRVYDPRGLYAAIPPGARYEHEFDGAFIAPDQIAAMLRSTGFSLLGSINPRGWVYTAAVLNPRGDDGRVIIDARTGAIIRFIPAFAINGRTDRELSALYGPPGPPLPPAVGEIYRAPPRPPVKAPKLASRTPPSAPMPQSQPGAKSAAKPDAASAPAPVTPAKPVVAAAPEMAKPVEANPAEAKPAEAAAPVAKPPELELKPTQDMPPVQTLD